MSPAPGPLDGVRVLDFTWVGAGPLTTRLLADFGAEVIKIESAARPDPLRTTPPLAPRFAVGAETLERSGYFANRNANKKSFALDLSVPESRDVILRLVAVSDICAQSFRPGTMEKWHLGYEELRAARPDLIYLAMPMQGESGPHAHFSGFGATLVALSGLFDLCGDPDRLPVGTGTNYPDHVPNPMHAAVAVLAALIHRKRTGEGQRIELSQLESTVNVIGPAIERAAADASPHRMGNRVEYACPHGVYPSAGDDAWVAISVMDDDQWRALHELLPPDSLPRTRLDDVASRKAAEDHLDHAISAWTAGQEREQIVGVLQERGVAAGPVRTSADLLNGPNELTDRDAFAWLDHPVMGRCVYTAPTARLSRTPGEMVSAAPLLGQHTDELCCELLGLSDTEITGLRSAGVLR